jgi:hypothetical protein
LELIGSPCYKADDEEVCSVIFQADRVSDASMILAHLNKNEKEAVEQIDDVDQS